MARPRPQGPDRQSRVTGSQINDHKCREALPATQLWSRGPWQAHSLGSVAKGQRCVEACDGGSMVLCCPPPHLFSAGELGDLGTGERSLGRKEEALMLG